MASDGEAVQRQTLKSLKRTHDLFLGNVGAPLPVDENSQSLKVASKLIAEYAHVKDLPQLQPHAQTQPQQSTSEPLSKRGRPSKDEEEEDTMSRLVQTVGSDLKKPDTAPSLSLVALHPQSGTTAQNRLALAM